MASYLADTSAWLLSQRRNAPAKLRKAFADLLSADEIAICAPVEWELLHSTNNASEYKALRQELAVLARVAFVEADWGRALDLGEALAKKGGSLHRAPSMPDAVVAVAAERTSLTVLHYDKDFDLIAGVTGQPCEWIVPKGSL